MDFESNLMMYMLGAESKLENMFSEGLDSFQKTLTNNLQFKNFVITHT